ncbi:MAG: helix-turn-helix domain-containing protein, partial [Candidatus Korarchaeota archaeon]
MTVTDMLKKYGLTENETKAYLYLLRVPLATIGEATERTGITYDVMKSTLESLVAKKFAVKIAPTGTLVERYVALAPYGLLIKNLEDLRGEISKRTEAINKELSEVKSKVLQKKDEIETLIKQRIDASVSEFNDKITKIVEEKSADIKKMQDAIATAFVELSSKNKDIVENAKAQIVKTRDEMNAKVDEITERFKSDIELFRKNVSDENTKLLALLKDAASSSISDGKENVLNKLNALIANLNKEIEVMIGGLQDMLDEEKRQIEKISKNVESEISNVAEKADADAGVVFKELLTKVDSLEKQFNEKNTKALEEAYNAFVALLGEKISSLNTSIESAHAKINSSIDTWKKDVTSSIDKFFESIKQKTDAVVVSLSQSTQKIFAGVDTLYEKISDSVNVFLGEVKSSLEVRNEKVKTITEKTIQDVRTTTISLIDKVNAYMEEFQGKVQKLLNDLHTDVQKKIELAKAETEKELTKGFELIKKEISNTITETSDRLESARETLTGALDTSRTESKKIVDAEISAVQKFSAETEAAIRDATSAHQEAISTLSESMINILHEQKDLAVRTLEEFISKVETETKAKLDTLLVTLNQLDHDHLELVKSNINDVMTTFKKNLAGMKEKVNKSLNAMIENFESEIAVRTQNAGKLKDSYTVKTTELSTIAQKELSDITEKALASISASIKDYEEKFATLQDTFKEITTKASNLNTSIKNHLSERIEAINNTLTTTSTQISDVLDKNSTSIRDNIKVIEKDVNTFATALKESSKTFGDGLKTGTSAELLKVAEIGTIGDAHASVIISRS